jgi:exonuclease SbcD
MLRLLHTADVHLGARHADLGEQATAQRERQFSAFRASVDLALDEKVDLFLIAGDLFDSNTQPRRSVERVVAELGRLAAAAVRTVIIPGTHDVYDRASVYRAYDLPALAGLPPDTDRLVVLTPDRPSVVFKSLDAAVYSRVFPTKRAPESPFSGFELPADAPTWRIGLVHGAVAIPGRTDGDEVVVTRDEIAASGLDYVALGHWHSAQTGKTGDVAFAYSGAPESVAIGQDGAGKVLLVTLDKNGDTKTVAIEERVVGRTRFEKLDVDAGRLPSQPALIELLAARADPDLVFDVRLTGVRGDDLDVHLDEVESELADRFLRIRVRDASLAALTDGPLPPPDTIIGAFIRDMEARIASSEKGDDQTEAGELRDGLRLGRLLLMGHEVTL